MSQFYNSTGGGGGTGDVVGPASSTDNAIARWDGTTGKLLADSIPTIDDQGNLNITSPISGGTLSIHLVNSSNTASSQAQILIQNGGVSSGDTSVAYASIGGQSWAHGMDVSASSAFVISNSDRLGSNDVVSISTAGATTFPAGNVLLTRAQVGGGVAIAMTNTDNTNPASDCAIIMNTGGSSAGDTFITFANTSVTAWTAGLDNSASDAFVIAASSTLGTSNAVSINASTQDVTVVNNLYAKRPIVTQSDSATFALTDANTWQKCTKGTAMTLTVPANATVAFPVGTEIDIYQQGAGQVTVAAAGGVTIHSAFGNLKIAAQYTGASLKKSDTDVWELVGNLTA